MATVCPFCGAHEISKKGACITWGCGSFLPRLGNVVGDPVQSINCNQIATLQKQNRVLREAMAAIDKHPTCGNSEPDSMAEALEQIHALAAAALEATKEGA